jgi:uncharacterized protein (UPF0548 family)
MRSRPYGATVQLGDLTYREVGATAGVLPDGYHHIRRRLVLGSGRERFAHAAEALMGWEMHRRAGLTVDTSSPRVTTGAEVVLGWGVGPARLRAPCRVVLTVDEPSARGFAYGTLAGHPESGEESFVVRLDGDIVRLDIVAFSRPARWYSRLGAPVSRLVQDRITLRYLAALRDAS